MSQKTIFVVNELSILKEAIIAETPSIGQKRIAWTGGTTPNRQLIEFDADEVLTLNIENGVHCKFDTSGYIKFPAWAEYDFNEDPSCPGEITVTRSELETKITIREGEAGFSLGLKFPEPRGAVPRPGEENVAIGDDQN